MVISLLFTIAMTVNAQDSEGNPYGQPLEGDGGITICYAYTQSTNTTLSISSPGKSIEYVSKLTPVIISKLTAKQIKTLSKKENIVYLGLKSERPPSPMFAYALPAVEAAYVKNTLGFNGYGVKIGMYDAGRAGTHTELNSSQITRLDTGVAVSSHATSVARVIAGSNGVATGAHLYSSSNGSTYEQGIENIISYGVAAINISLSFSRSSGNYYTDFEKWIDHISNQHKVTVVTSAGNSGISSVVSSPGLAYNTITVGSMDPNSTTNKSDDFFRDDYTSTDNGGPAGCAKPDVLAPGQLTLGGGTSYAAPMVTGIIAQMIEYKPTIASDPALIKAILTACTDRKVPPKFGFGANEVYEGTITAQQGAGVVNAKRAILILSGGKYFSSASMSTGTSTKTFPVPSGNTYIRFALAWIRPNTAATNHNSGTATAATAANLRLNVYRPSGALAASSNSQTSSVELVHFQVNSVFGTYSAGITRMDSGSNTFKYAMAWY